MPADAAQAGTGAVTVTEPFTVTPAAAACTASPPAASVTARGGRRRAVSATLDGPGSLKVTVTCTAAGRGPAQADVVLTHAGALTSITARVTGGGECTAATPPRRVEVAYRCMIGRGNTVTVAADTTATGPTLHTAWTATGAISLASPAQRGAVPLFGPDNTVAGWQRTATARLECTAKGTATATATLAGTDAKKTARLVIACGDAVRIDGLADATDNGTGTLTVTSGFTVTPPAAVCTTDPATATVTAGVGGARTLTASIAVPGSLEVTVTCKAAGRTDGIRQVTLAAARPCSEHLGALATGTVTRSGIITEGGCEAKARRPRTASVFYARSEPHWARRHTFTLDTPGWVTISLDDAQRPGADPLDTYAVLLKDDNNKGTPIARNDNGGLRIDARLTDIFLQPGSYTIEATTKQPQTTGNYRLTVTVDHTPRASGQPAVLDADVGIKCRKIWRYQPGAATAAITSRLAEGVTATINAAEGLATLTATATRAGEYDIDITYTNGPDVGTRTTTITATCPTNYTATAVGTCVPRTGKIASDCEIAWLHNGLIWGLRRAAGHFSNFDGRSAPGCSSLAGLRGAKHYKFYLPSSAPTRIELGALNLMVHGGAPLVSLWRYVDHDNSGDVRFVAAVQAARNATTPAIEHTLAAGTYVVEMAATKPIANPLPRYELRAWLPTAVRTHSDVQRVGNTGLGGAGLNLGGFLDARGSLAYNDHPDPAQRTDPAVAFDPLSATYPWLPFTTDRCSIPPAWILHLAETAIDRAAIRLGPLTWLAAQYRLPNADEIQDHPQFGGVTVPFVYGCMRHDFNWRNLHRVKNHLGYDTTAGTWNNTVRKDADTRLGTDLVGLCESNQPGAPETSSYHKWKLPNSGAVRRCKQAAKTITAAVGKVPFSWIGSDYDHD